MPVELLKFVWDAPNIVLTVSSWLMIVVAAGTSIGLFVWRKRIPEALSKWRADSITLSFGNVSATVKPDHETVRIAHRAWAELVTRKAALPFDPEHDVIAEIYDSWYDLFRELRELTKSIPAESLRDSEDARDLLRILIAVLNEGMRPHLTQWQARFRRWYEVNLGDADGSDPQELQKRYPQYDDLTDDLEKVSSQISGLSVQLQKLAHGGDTK